MDRTLVELMAALRRAGLHVSTAETLDAVRALAAVGVARRDDLVDALAATVLRGERDRTRFEAAAGAFFDRSGAEHPDVFARLRAAGFSEDEVQGLRGLLEQLAGGPAQALAAVIGGGSALAQLLDEALSRLPPAWLQDSSRAGFTAMRALEAAELPRSRTQLQSLRTPLADAFGARGLALLDRLERELSEMHGKARTRLDQRSASVPEEGLRGRPFEHLSEEELGRMQAWVQRLARRLLESERVRARHARSGRLDGRATLRRALSTGGIPFRPAFRHTRRRPSNLLVFCDISDSVRATARLSLAFVHAAQRMFASMRSFVFVSDVGEATRWFAEQPVDEAIARAYRGEIVSVADNSNYGRALARLDGLLGDAIDPRAILLVIGDGRTNHFPPGDAVLSRLRGRVGRLVWFNPQPRARWYEADSAMRRYERHLDAAFEVHDLASFDAAVRGLLRVCRSPGRLSGSC